MTGATGIAAAVVSELASQDARVAVLAKEPTEIADLESSLPDGSEMLGLKCDLTDEASTDEAFEEVLGQLGAINGVVGVAGGSGRRFGDGDIATMSLESWEDTLEMNATPAFLTLRNAIRHASRPASVVLISSVLATSPEPRHFGTHGYAASKGAINALVRSVAAAYASEGISVNAVAPGLVSTPMSARAREDAAIREFTRTRQPLAPDMLAADDVARVVVSVLTSPTMTGQIVTVDAGWSVMS